MPFCATICASASGCQRFGSLIVRARLRDDQRALTGL